jgi:hypothetical protein
MEEDKVVFNKLLGSAGLNKKEFAELTGLHYGSVANWGGKDKPVPSWVASWIEYYIKAKTLDSVRGVICPK